MKTGNISRRRGMTLIEAVIVIAVLAVLLAMLLPALSKTKTGRSRINCISNLKQAGTGFRLFANDNHGRLPSFTETNQAWNYFQIVGSDIGSPRVLLCPQDAERMRRLDRKQRALYFENDGSPESFSHPENRNAALSYFYGLDADQNDTENRILLAGDRNISTNALIHTGPFLITSNALVNWTSNIHSNQGNILLSDGAAQRVTTEELRSVVKSAGADSQQLILP